MRGVIWFFSMTIFTYLCFCFSLKTLTETGYEKYNEVTCFHALAAEQGAWLCRAPAVCQPQALQSWPSAAGRASPSSLGPGPFLPQMWFDSGPLTSSTCGFSEHLFICPVPICHTPHRSRAAEVTERVLTLQSLSLSSGLPRDSRIHRSEQIHLS